MNIAGISAKALIFLAAALFGNSAFAATSEWVQGEAAFKLAHRLGSENMIVTDVKCKDSGSPGLGVGVALAQFTYKPNVKNTKWAVDGWENLEANKRHWQRKGYHLVKYSVFSRNKSGLRIYCTLYYK
jgi:hypothetical protein